MWSVVVATDSQRWPTGPGSARRWRAIIAREAIPAQRLRQHRPAPAQARLLGGGALSRSANGVRAVSKAAPGISRCPRDNDRRANARLRRLTTSAATRRSSPSGCWARHAHGDRWGSHQRGRWQHPVALTRAMPSAGGAVVAWEGRPQRRRQRRPCPAHHFGGIRRSDRERRGLVSRHERDRTVSCRCEQTAIAKF